MLFFNVVVKERFTIDDIGHGDNLLNKKQGIYFSNCLGNFNDMGNDYVGTKR